jgi:hypothetical protein
MTQVPQLYNPQDAAQGTWLSPAQLPQAEVQSAESLIARPQGFLHGLGQRQEITLTGMLAGVALAYGIWYVLNKMK